MTQTGFESRVKVKQIIESQLPEFILDESPKFVDFLKQYYISQEYQSGPIDLVDNLDQYLKLDNLSPEVVVGYTDLSSSISSTDTVIKVSSTKGFPSNYGLLKIDDEIITYTGITTNTFTGCIRGFSGITNYHQDLNSEELVFSTSSSVDHLDSTTVENLSVLFLQEFYKKIKYSLTPELENKDFVSNLNVGNFIKEARTLYQSKGTEESFRILFNILFGETPKVIDLEQFLIKPSSATYIRRGVVVADAISGDLSKLQGQTIFKNNDSNTTASVSEVEIIQRKNKTYYKLLLFIGYDDTFSTITGDFKITGSSKNIETISIGSSIISVDSTIGFPDSGTLYYNENIITYSNKSINQFFECSGITTEIPIASTLYSDETYYGYEDGDKSKEVKFRITGVLSGYKSIENNRPISVGEKIYVKNVGEIIENKKNNPTYKEIFANSWIYNTSSRYQIDTFSPGTISQINLKSEIDKSSLKIGDHIDILSRDSQEIIISNLKIINIVNQTITLDNSFVLNQSLNYDIRRKLNYANSSSVELEFDSIISDIQNVYNNSNEYMYVASNSLPSYEIKKSIFSYDVSSLDGLIFSTGLYSTLVFSEKISFKTGSEVYYKPSNSPILGLSEGVYYVEVISINSLQSKIKLYVSKSVIGTINYVTFGNIPEGTHNFTLNSQKEQIISAQKILRKFPLSVDIKKSDLTVPGATGILINGVEILNYKSNDKVYYGPLKSVDILNGGIGYDVINPPLLSISSGNALIEPVVSGSIEKVYVDPQGFNVDVIVSVAVTGGNGSGASFQPVIERKRREIEFDAREIVNGGGIDVTNETITFLTNHNLINGQSIIYRPGGNNSLGIGPYFGSNLDSGNTLKSESTYYVKYINDTTIQLYPTISDFNSGINTVGFTTIGTSGIHKFVTEPKNTLTEIKVINGGTGYTNRKLRVLPSGISTSNNSIFYNNHGFEDGELVTYNTTGSSISGLSTSNQYYILKNDDHSFRLSNAGIGGTIKDDYLRKKYVALNSIGSGYHIFNYPEISLNVDYTSVGFGSTQVKGSIVSTLVVKGSIIDTYIYNEGSDYGSSVLNFHKKPSVILKNGKNAQFEPVIVNGRIEDVSILNSGTEYYSVPDIQVSGSGIGCILRAIVSNNKIDDIIVVNPGFGYSTENTTITAVSSGKNAIFDPQVRDLTVNNNILYNNENDNSEFANEIIFSSYNNLQYSVSGYSEYIQNMFGEVVTIHSPIIGWAYDGNPIYGSYGYSNPKDSSSTIKRLSSGYVIDENNISNRPSTTDFSLGFFVDDYKFNGSGDLDECNGRFCVTPEFPEGVYAYFATSILDDEGNIVGYFPYFIGNRYRSKFIVENKSLNQSFDFNNSNLIRNTLPYKVNDPYAGNDFIVESNEVLNQITNVESVTSGPIENFEVINGGDNYKVGDLLVFDENSIFNNELISEVSEIFDKDIVDLKTSTTSYTDAVFTLDDKNKVRIQISPNHSLNNLDYVKISGFSTSLSVLNGFEQIGVTSFTSSLINNISSYSTTGIVTDIYISNLPENISIGSSIKINSETLSILNIFESKNIIRVLRETTGTAHSATSPIYFIPDTFTINKSLDYFDSRVNDLIYFNPKYSIGIGTTSGIGTRVSYNIGIQTNNLITIPTQSVFLPNHPFQTNQAIILRKPSSASAISVKETAGGSTFNLPLSGNSQIVYVIKKSSDYIGIVTAIGLTTTTDGLFFTSNGTNNYQYSFESSFNQIKGNIEKNITTISVSTTHTLKSGDTISLSVKPNLSVGIGTSSSIKVIRDQSTGYILINPINFSSSNINTLTNTITINSHKLKTGDKIKYTANTVASGLSTGFYFVYKVDDNTIKLSETYIDCAKTSPPNTVTISGVGGSSHNIFLVNPQLLSVRNNNLVFNLQDSSLFGYNFKLFYDQDFNSEFVSTGSTNTFSISGVGTVGLSTNASLTLSYSNELPTRLFYSLEKSGYISTSDKEVINYSEINYVDSKYKGLYKIFGIGSTTFNISLQNTPEKVSYTNSECDELTYTTTSNNTSGKISKIKIISSSSNFKQLPVFEKVESLEGSGAFILPKSNKIGEINEIKILNEGFEYSADKTLRPEALISQLATIKNSNTLSSVNVVNGGKNYISIPDLVIINSETGEKINSGLLSANLFGTSIGSVKIESYPKGLPESIVTIRSINNTNGVGIQTVEASSSGIVTCTLITPLSGFSVEPFASQDQIFVEGIQINNDGDGLNSENYGYNFFKILSYQNANTLLPRKLEFSLSEFTTNPGTPKLVGNVYGTVINYKNYPQFSVTQVSSNFIESETLQVKLGTEFVDKDLRLINFNDNTVQISGTYTLEKNNIIRGSRSGTIATINEINQSTGTFIVDYQSIQKNGWLNDIGKLNDDKQVIPDNNYYQNLSYSVKSNQEWVDIISPVNNLLHPTGLKNFSDTQILKSINVGISKTSVKEYVDYSYSIINESRVDRINNFDFVVDFDTFSASSKFLKFKRKKLADYIECRTNRVLEIDDISSQFSSSDLNQNLSSSSKISDIISSRKYNRYLVQISKDDYSQSQFNEIIILNNDSDVFTLEKGSINTGELNEIGYESNKIGDIYGYIDENDSFYLKFEPKDKFNSTYNIKYLNTTFSNFNSGIGSTSIGFVNLIGITSTISSGFTTSLIQYNISNTKSIYSQIHLIDNITNDMNYVEIFVDHDGTNTNISEFYFDAEDQVNSNYIGSFGASINGGILNLNYTNTTNNAITIRSRNIGFASTSVGIGTYRFKQSGQIDDTEKTVNYSALYSNVSSASTIISFDISKFTSIKSSIKVSIGNTSALHQIMLITDGIDVYTSQYPFLSIGSTSGIGTFGGEITGSTVSLKFYPDSNILGTFEILSFNESFYKENDFINESPNLQYGNVLESVGVKKYFAINDNALNKLDFELNYKETPIFMKTFNPSDSLMLNLSTGEFNIPNHFFSTGEELIYRPNTTFVGVAVSSVGIGSTLNYAGIVTNILPPTVYAIKINNDKFKLSSRKDYANVGIFITFTSFGSGNAHELEMFKKDEKTIISVDNIVQSPIAYSLLNYSINNGNSIGSSSTIFGLSGISSIRLNDILKIDNEYMKVVNVGLGTTYSGPISFAGTFPLVNVERGCVGSISTSHSNLTPVLIYRGSFKIVKNKIYFTESPKGSLEDQLLIDEDNLPFPRSSFEGRVFLRQDYTSNQIYDNISEKFTGIGQTYTLTVGGANTVGLGTSGGNGIVLINGVYQTPTTENNSNKNFSIIENTFSGISSVVFSGITSTNGSIIISQSDVNMNQLPRGGVIVSLGSTPGLGYAPLVGASVTAIVSGGVIVSIGIDTNNGGWGSGYRNPVSIAVTDANHVGSAATITATVGAGGTLSFTIVGGGTGYSNNPTINIPSPSYSNLPVIGVSRLGIGTTTQCGTGLLLNVDVGASSTTGIGSTLFEVTNFKIVRTGYGFIPGDIIKPVGLVTAYDLSSPISEFTLTVLDTFTDSFSAWQFGELDYIDSIKIYQDGIRTRFPLYYNSELLSFEKNDSDLDSQLIDFNSLLVIFINSILQKPGVSYEFTGGTSFTFNEAPKPEDNIDIYFYRGTREVDSKLEQVNESIKIGDELQVFSRNDYLGITTTQTSRIVTNIPSSDKVETNLYINQGIDETIFKPVYWTKQKKDKIIDGRLVSKSRNSIETQIYPTAKIIKNITTTDSTLYLDNSVLFNYENDISSNPFDAIIISGNSEPVSAAITSVVSIAGTIQSLSIANPGSGYTGSSVNIKISPPSTIGVGIGTTATAIASLTNGSISSVTVINPGLGYSIQNPPQVLVEFPSAIYENITNITGIAGTFGNIIGIGTTVGIGTNLAIRFTLSQISGLNVGDPIYIYNTKVGKGVTSIINTNSSIIGIGTTYLDNIYYINGIYNSSGSTGIITCNIHSQTSIVGIATTGSYVGNFSWGKLTGFTRSSSPISIGVSGYTVNSGLNTFPTIQRRGYGLRNNGSLNI